MPTLSLPAPIQEAVTAFEALQTKYQALGAKDTEPEWVLHDNIRRAATNRPFHVPVGSGWELYSDEGNESLSSEAPAALTAQAMKVYDAIREHAVGADAALKGYAWRCAW